MFGGKKAKELEEELLALQEKQNRLQPEWCVKQLCELSDQCAAGKPDTRKSYCSNLDNNTYNQYR